MKFWLIPVTGQIPLLSSSGFGCVEERPVEQPVGGRCLMPLLACGTGDEAMTSD